MADITISQGMQMTRAALSPASSLAAKKRAREKRMYQTADGLKDEDEFGDMLIAALTTHRPVEAVAMVAETDQPLKPKAEVTAVSGSGLVQNGYIANYFQ